MKNDNMQKIIVVVVAFCVLLALLMVSFMPKAHSQTFSDYKEYKTCIEVTPASLDIHSIDFIMFQNNMLHIESVEGTGISLTSLGNNPEHSIQYDIYFKLDWGHYELYIPDENILFKVSSDTPINLGASMLRFFELIDFYRQNKQQTTKK